MICVVVLPLGMGTSAIQVFTLTGGGLVQRLGLGGAMGGRCVRRSASLWMVVGGGLGVSDGVDGHSGMLSSDCKLKLLIPAGAQLMLAESSEGMLAWVRYPEGSGGGVPGNCRTASVPSTWE